MVTQRKPKPSKYLTIPTRPVQVDRDRSVAGLLEKMEGTGFGGRQLAEAHRIWLDMLGDNTTIMMAASGALIPAGMRRLLAYVVKNRFVDVLVLSGSVIFHDLHETLGRHHFQAHPNMTEAELESAQINRMWDLLASEEEYHEAEVQALKIEARCALPGKSGWRLFLSISVGESEIRRRTTAGPSTPQAAQNAACSAQMG